MDKNVVMPAFALCGSITEDSLRAWATDMSRWSDARTTGEERMTLFREMNARSDRFVRYYSDERPWQHSVASRMRLTALFFNRAGSGPLFHAAPIHPSSFRKPIEALDAPMHWAILCGGIIAALWSLRQWRKERLQAWLAGMTIISVFVVPWALRLCEGRYLVPMYPWLLLLVVLAAVRLTGPRSAATAR